MGSFIGTRTLLIATLLCSLAGFALLTTTAQAEAIPATVRLCDGRSVSGTIDSVDADVVRLTVDGRPQQFPLDDVRGIEVATASGASTSRSWLLLSNGDRVPLVPVDLVDDAFVCRWENGRQQSNCRVALELVTVVLRQPLHAPAASSMLPELSRRTFSDDTLMLSDGTRLTGALDGVTADLFRLETAVGIVPIEAFRVVAVAMNAALVQRPPDSERAALVALRDGAWLTLHDLTIAGDGTLSGRTAFDAELAVPLTDIERIALYGPRVVDPARRPLDDIETTPFVSRTSPPLVNRNVRGGWLQLGGREYARGFGMTSHTSATIALEHGDRRFQATVGLDDSVGAAGSVVFTVAVDGRRVFTSPIVHGGDAPSTIGPLDIAGGERLTLSVEFAEYGNVEDVANWCDPIILR